MSANLPDIQDENSATTIKSPIVKKEQEAVQEEQAQPPSQHRQLQWLRTQTEALQKLVGQWIVVEGEKIIAHGYDPIPVVIDAQAQGIKIPYLFYVDKIDKNVARIGL